MKWRRIVAPKQLVVDTRNEFRAAVEALSSPEVAVIEIDLGETTYIDSSGLSMLVTTRKSTMKTGTEIVLSNLNDELSTLFTMTRLDGLFFIRGRARADQDEKPEEPDPPATEPPRPGLRLVKRK